MTANGWTQIVLFLVLVLAATKPLGAFMARVFNRERTFLDPLVRPLERLIYRTTGVDDEREMRRRNLVRCRRRIWRSTRRRRSRPIPTGRPIRVKQR
jgi:K+-transporting ATPase A subunit